MKIGVILPTFRDTPHEALETAQRAEALGLDGVFCYDHLWPMGQPARPALAPFPVLGTLASATSRVVLGTLVARVGLVPAEVLIGEFATLDLVARGRIVAGIGTGDHLSAAENLAYGIDYPPADDRLAELRHCATVLDERGITVWVGGRGPATLAIARDLGVAANLWDAGLEEVEEKTRHCELTWAGPVPSGADDTQTAAELRTRLAGLRDAGASWAVFAYPAPLELLADEVQAAPSAAPEAEPAPEPGAAH